LVEFGGHSWHVWEHRLTRPWGRAEGGSITSGLRRSGQSTCPQTPARIPPLQFITQWFGSGADVDGLRGRTPSKNENNRSCRKCQSGLLPDAVGNAPLQVLALGMAPAARE
jgi:hypothetical protein